MMILLRPDASEKDITYVLQRAASLGLRTHVTEQDGRRLVGLLGDLRGLDLDVLAGLRGVDCVRPVSRPFQLASRELKAEPTIVDVKGCPIGGARIVVMAGPCSVESLDRTLATARRVKAAGASILRGGAFKPRSSPYSFRGLADQGLEILAETGRATGLLTVTEVMSPELVDRVAARVDILQIGARNMQNFSLLDAVGETRMPVLLKRGMMSTIEECLLSAEYVLSHGNPNVILCERGIRTFETYTRNTLDISAVPLLKALSHLPVIVDPSHATGRPDLVRPVSRAAIAAGCDGLLIEVHHEPETAWSDAFQTLSAEEFQVLMDEARRLAPVIDRYI